MLLTGKTTFRGYIGIGLVVIGLLAVGDGGHFINAHQASAQVPEAEIPAMAPQAEALTAPVITSGLLGVLSSLIQDMHSLVEPAAGSQPMPAWITHYGERFNEKGVGCYDYGDYSSEDPTIVAVNPTLYEHLPCGTLLELCGPGGCMVAARKDSCPGCRPDGFDLSEAGFKKVCGDSDGVCTATVQVLTVCQVRKFGTPAEEAARLEAEEAALTGRIPCHPEET
jgi:hypothetical protein